MMESTAAYLEKLTQEYWFLSSAWQGRCAHCLTTSGAIRFGKNIETSLGEHRALRPRIHTLLDAIIIRGDPKQKAHTPASPSASNVVKLDFPVAK